MIFFGTQCSMLIGIQDLMWGAQLVVICAACVIAGA